MSITPRQAWELNHVRLFDAGCVKTRLDELTALFVSEMATAEMQRLALKAKKRFETPQPYDLPLPKLYELFGEQARKQAQEVLEKERQGYVDSISSYILRILVQVCSQLRFMVYTVDENGKPCKVQRITEKIMKPNYRGDWDFQQVEYVGDHDFERLQQIGLLLNRLEEFRDYMPYFNEDEKKAWDIAVGLSNLEVVVKEESKLGV
jgi:hypothetical protein